MDPQQHDQSLGIQEATVLTAAVGGPSSSLASSSSSTANGASTKVASTSSSIATSSRPDAHTQRYDRQLRLWASSGQRSLESSNVLVVGSAHLASCVLKNLILPGIGSFTLLDDEIVTEADLGNNFFLEHTSLGTSRAEESVRCLLELNPGVKGTAKTESVAELIAEAPEFFSSFTLIIAVNQPPNILHPLAELAWGANRGTGIPLIAARGAGFMGQCRLQVKELGIIETHPESTVDLRLTSPWPALQSWAEAYDVHTSDTMERSHIPYVVILLRKLQDWAAEHGSLPVPGKDRKAFADAVNAGRQKGNADEENYDEAIAALGQHVWRPLQGGGRRIPSAVEALLEDESCIKVSKDSTNFWLLLNALRSFVKAGTSDSPAGGDGHLPLPGSLPDMKALSKTYVELQRLYKDKAAQDVAALKAHLAKTLQTVGLEQGSISDEEIESFAKHAGYVHLIRGRSLAESAHAPASEAIMMAFMDPVNPVTIVHHVAFEAADRFYLKHARYPGSSRAFSRSITGARAASAALATNVTLQRDGGAGGLEDKRAAKRPRSREPDGGTPVLMDVDGSEDLEADFDEDVTELLNQLTSVLEARGVTDEEQVEQSQDACRELARSGHADLPSTAALMGGVVAQEAIKLITRQYIPVDNTAVYDGIQQAVGTFRL